MLTESFIAATFTANKAVAHASATLKDVGIFLHEFQPQSAFRHGYKKSSSQRGCVAISDSHIFAAQADKAVINVYSRERGNQEATVPFPERLHSLAFAQGAAILAVGTEGGKLILWEVATGRVTNSAASHLQAVSCLCLPPNNEYIISGSADSSIHVWSLSKLVSFPQLTDNYGSEEPPNTPIRTFSGHRAPITAITCGHSNINTNFAISASTDGTCYVWHIENCQPLRTLLLPSMAVSITIDPADRVIYFGCDNGRIQSWDIFGRSKGSRTSLSTSSAVTPIQLPAQDSWIGPAAETGAATCLTLSHDGTSLLSGHSNGAIIRWDVAKHRILNEITNLGQPVTNIEMLRPKGLPDRKNYTYTITNIVKPDLEFASLTDNGACGVPAKYSLRAMITVPWAPSNRDEFGQALAGPGFPQSMLDGAVRALTLGNGVSGPSSADDTEKWNNEKLVDEISKLKRQIAVLHRVEEKRMNRKLARMKKREEIGLKKREAYFEAKKKGKDGDTAMKKWEEQEAMLDVESDDENPDGMETG
ncbi:uncharacterized protein Z518_05690 [Rhinocladiella mackenziei CBS 650.93]|uniref:Pre-rRNA-processing protein IPI3 n=1 Tax=Rhinocladiella mackenziei CBS 650.93 TaxID=1442369 RepID=A0A0D2IGA4_9EURO|nr:uncharacterized protein Z518_05690 [Rhinocladiella mackenziei CBS 650.93]KIX04819.1 hypothetical protein Z518_05690 [Rhinocladiella mackenziei CBS 650.93]